MLRQDRGRIGQVRGGIGQSRERVRRRHRADELRRRRLRIVVAKPGRFGPHGVARRGESRGRDGQCLLVVRVGLANTGVVHIEAVAGRDLSAANQRQGFEGGAAVARRLGRRVERLEADIGISPARERGPAGEGSGLASLDVIDGFAREPERASSNAALDDLPVAAAHRPTQHTVASECVVGFAYADCALLTRVGGQVAPRARLARIVVGARGPVMTTAGGAGAARAAGAALRSCAATGRDDGEPQRKHQNHESNDAAHWVPRE